MSKERRTPIISESFQEYLQESWAKLRLGSDPKEPEDYLRVAEVAWRIYQLDFKTLHERRLGYSAYGALGMDPLEGRAQSVAEHEHLCVTLAHTIQSYLPGFFSTMAWQDILFVLHLHDTSEVWLGDVLDDGGAQHDKKNQREAEINGRFLEMFGWPSAKFQEILKYKDMASEIDRTVITQLMGRFVHLVDKIAALLDLCLCEQMGRPGSMCIKRLNGLVTARDRDSARKTRSIRPLDIWSYSFVAHSKARYGCAFDPLFEAILRVAVRDTRGEEGFPWLDRFFEGTLDV